MVQNSATLGVTAVAGGVLATGTQVFDTPLLAVIIALVVWLLALMACLNWAEMSVFARRRDIADEQVAKLLARDDLANFDRLRQMSPKRDWATKIAITAVVALCFAAFGAAFLAGIFVEGGENAATIEIRTSDDIAAVVMRGALAILAILTVVAALRSKWVRVKSLG